MRRRHHAVDPDTRARLECGDSPLRLGEHRNGIRSLRSELAADVVVAVDEQRQSPVRLAEDLHRPRVSERGVERDHRHGGVVAVRLRVPCELLEAQEPAKVGSSPKGKEDQAAR